MYEPERPAEVTQTVSKIRPAWLLGGGAAAIAFGVCALLSLCAAVPLVWLTVQRNNQQAEETQVAVVRQTEQGITLTPNPTRTPAGLVTQAVPTLIAVSTQAVPVQTQAGVPVATQGGSLPGNVLPPDQAVRTYYQMVSQQRYDLSWAMLSENFKQKFNCCAPNYNYSGYTAWWDSVDYVDFGSVNTVSQSGNRAVVYAETYFVMTDGRRSSVDSNPYIELIYDTASGGWRFEDKRATA
jgi:hypothetical protein